MAESGERPFVERKTRDRAFVLPLLGLVLLLPPIAMIFQLEARILGVPFTVLYLFAVWALLIIGAAYLSRDLNANQDIRDHITDDPGD